MKISSYERRAIEQASESVLLGRAFDRAQECFAEEEINPNDFVKFYGEKDVQKNLEWVSCRKKQFAENSAGDKAKKESEMQAVVLEAILTEQIELSNWFGEKACAIKSSEYDDIANGVDTILEFEKGEKDEVLPVVALDVTYGDRVESKMQRIKEEIEIDKLTDIKYFKSTRLNKKAKDGLHNVPRVIVGVDSKAAKELIDLWMDKDKKALAEHPVQLQILEQTRMQLEAFEIFARKIGNEKSAEILKRRREIIEKVLEKKETELGVNIDFENDKVFSAIDKGLINFTK
ncbi:hypothetical protein ACFLZC_01545 [Patescibacteria group bacterium]